MKQVCIQQARKSVCDRPDLLRPARRGREADEAYPTGPESDARAGCPLRTCPASSAPRIGREGCSFGYGRADDHKRLPLTYLKRLAPRAGLEPATLRLTVVARKSHRDRLRRMMIRPLNDLP